MAALQPITLGLGLVDLYARLDATRVEAQKVSNKQDAFDLSGLLQTVSGLALASTVRALQADLDGVKLTTAAVSRGLDGKLGESDLTFLNRLISAKADRSAQDALSRSLADRPTRGDLDAVRDRAPPSRQRPGDGPSAFTFARQLAACAGEADSLAPLPSNLIAPNASGSVLRIEGAGIVFAREAEPIESGRIRAVRATVSRFVNSPDPNNDTVRLGVVWLDRYKQIVSGDVVADLTDLVVASGRQARAGYISASAGPGVTLVAPGGAVAFRRYVQAFGAGGVVDVEILAGEDVTDSTVPPTASVGLVQDVSALKSLDAGTRLLALEGAVSAPNSATFATVADAVAGIIPATATTVETRGWYVPGDGQGGVYFRVPSASTGRQGFVNVRDGSAWRRSLSTFQNQAEGPFPTPSVHHIVTDPDRHAAGRLVVWPNGLWSMIYRSAYRHHIDYKAELRIIDSLDEFNGWTPEFTLVSDTGSDLGGDVGAMLPDGRYAVVSPTLKPDPNDETKNLNETPTAYIVDVNKNVQVVQLTLENGVTSPGFGLVGFWSGEYRAGGTAAVPGVIQFLFYGAGRIYRCFYQNGAFTPLEIILAAGSGPTGTTLSEAVIGYAPDGRGYMLIRDSNAAVYQANEQRRPLLGSFSSVVNGKEVWSSPKNLPITWSSVPPYLIQWGANDHFLYTRSARSNNVVQDCRGHLVALNIDPTAFIASGGQSGFTQVTGGLVDWQAKLALPAWPHIQGGPTQIGPREWALSTSYGENFKLPSLTQGAPCRMAVVTNRQAPSISEQGILHLIGTGNGRPESYNGGMQVWTLGEAKRQHLIPTQRLEACDGVSARRTGSAGGTYVEAVSDGVQKVLRWGREQDDPSLAAMNMTGALYGEDLDHLRGQWCTFCQLFKPGPGFNATSNAVISNVIATTIAGTKITGTDGSYNGSFSLLSDSRTVPGAKSTVITKQQYYSDPFCFYVPPDVVMLSWILTRVPTINPAPFGDWLDIRRAEIIRGDRPTMHKLRPYSEYADRTKRILRSTYPKGIIPGTPETFLGSLKGRHVYGNTANTGAQYVRWEYDMLETPVATLFSPKTGARGMVSAAGGDYAGQIVDRCEKSLDLTPVGVTQDNATFNGHVLARCAAWAN